MEFFHNIVDYYIFIEFTVKNIHTIDKDEIMILFLTHLSKKNY